MKHCILWLFAALSIFSACFPGKRIDKQARADLFRPKGLENALIGVQVFDANSGLVLYGHQDENYFVPASNTKLFSLYAGLKYLGDSIVGMRYMETDSGILVLPSGDPTLLHRDYAWQPVIDFLKRKNLPVYISDAHWKEEGLGPGWSWDDYNDDYMVERSPMPVYGNIIQWNQQQQPDQSFSSYSIPDINWKVDFADSTGKHFFVKRNFSDNSFMITEGTEKFRQQDVPFVTGGLQATLDLLKDTVGKRIFITHTWPAPDKNATRTIYSRPVDSLYRPMMFRSDNFFAEQTLLMSGNERLGIMNDAAMIDTLLSTDLAGLPQRPEWVDGSGLSRYNLFSPADFVWILNKMKNEFGLERMKRILPTGGSGTLGSYYKQDSGRIFAKTGSLSGVICLSGYLLTERNRLLIFSVLANNYPGRGPVLRRAVAQFVDYLLSNY